MRFCENNLLYINKPIQINSSCPATDAHQSELLLPSTGRCFKEKNINILPLKCLRLLLCIIILSFIFVFDIYQILQWLLRAKTWYIPTLIPCSWIRMEAGWERGKWDTVRPLLRAPGYDLSLIQTLHITGPRTSQVTLAQFSCVTAERFISKFLVDRSLEETPPGSCLTHPAASHVNWSRTSCGYLSFLSVSQLELGIRPRAERIHPRPKSL